MFIIFISFSHLLEHPAVRSLSARRLILDYQVRLELFISIIVQYYRIISIVVLSSVLSFSCCRCVVVCE